MNTPDKPLFIPLKREWFEAFKNGDKDREYRPANWLQRSAAGRRVTLSLGYSGPRISGEIVSARLIPLAAAPEGARAIYAGRETHLTEIVIETAQAREG